LILLELIPLQDLLWELDLGRLAVLKPRVLPSSISRAPTTAWSRNLWALQALEELWRPIPLQFRPKSLDPAPKAPADRAYRVSTSQ
jgi:hypothetical protein